MPQDCPDTNPPSCEQQALLPGTTVTVPWHCLPPADALRSFGSRPEGLSDQEADRRLKLHGANAFRTAKPASAWSVLAAQLRSSLVLLFFFLMMRRPPRATLLPYTTLFR